MKFCCIACSAAVAAAGVLTLSLSMGAGSEAGVDGAAPQAAAVVAQSALAAPQSAATTFNIDAVHSSVIFRIEHMGVANFYGAFKEISGIYALNPEAPDESRFDIAIKTASVDTRNNGRDNHLRSPDFFNAAEFPDITFKSTKVESAGENKLKVTGDLSLHGVTKPITVEMKVWPAKQTRQGFKSGVEATFTIKRTDFDMDTYVAEGGLGDEVTVTFAGEGASATQR